MTSSNSIIQHYSVVIAQAWSETQPDILRTGGQAVGDVGGTLDACVYPGDWDVLVFSFQRTSRFGRVRPGSRDLQVEDSEMIVWRSREGLVYRLHRYDLRGWVARYKMAVMSLNRHHDLTLIANLAYAGGLQRKTVTTGYYARLVFLERRRVDQHATRPMLPPPSVPFAIHPVRREVFGSRCSSSSAARVSGDIKAHVYLKLSDTFHTRCVDSRQEASTRQQGLLNTSLENVHPRLQTGEFEDVYDALGANKRPGSSQKASYATTLDTLPTYRFSGTPALGVTSL
ncbi:hypothetical protein BC629DRAFT_1440221 [Irpex lacteus]|nr:hypothetical protein BC629DRAFT_1440221 [Irpex lacteus]